MALTRTNGASWGVGDKFTSSQANGIDIMITNALDKRSGQTDTLSSIVSCAGAGRIVDSYVAGPDANTTFLLSGANTIINATTLTASRTYRLSNTGAVAGDRVTILRPAAGGSALWSVTVQNDSPSTIAVLGIGTDINSDSTWGDFMFTGTAWIVARSSLPAALISTTFTANGTWTCPRGINLALLIGWGGGGGGAGGGTGSTGASGPCTTGGGGGGGAQLYWQIVTVTPGTGYAVTIGTGGGSVGTDTDGSNGADTTFGALATFVGAQGGIQGAVNSVVASSFGGGPVRLISNSVLSTRSISTDVQVLVQRTPGAGGVGRNDPNNSGFTGFAGTGSTQGFTGGNGAAKGTTNGTANGGGGGGGGGGGPAGVGAAAGAGGGGGNVGSAGGGAAGTAAAVNTGAGGGGGGGGGQCTAGGASVPGPGGAGGAGGSGQLTVVPLR